MESIPYIGEAFALASPLCWSLAVILFRKTGEVVPALALNLFKNALALALFFTTLRIMGQMAPADVGAGDYVLLLVSGAIGIGLSDAFFFMCLNRVGAGLQAIVSTSYSPSIILLSVLFLGERLSAVQVFGVAAILGAVLSIVWVREPARGITPRALAAGVGFGLLATSTQAVSIVMIKPLLNQSPLVWANCWRLLGGLLTSALWLPLMPGRWAALASLRERRVWPVMISAAVLGTYVALIFWLGGMKYTQASTASALNQTSTLFTFALAALLLHEPVTRRRLVGLALGAGGVLLVTFGG